MNDKALKAISDKLTILIRLDSRKEKSEELTTNNILDLVEGMNLTDPEIATMFGISAQGLRNARSKKKKGEKNENK